MQNPFSKPDEAVAQPAEQAEPVAPPVQVVEEVPAPTPVVETPVPVVEEPQAAPVNQCPFCNGTGLLGQPHVIGNQVCASCLGRGVK